MGHFSSGTEGMDYQERYCFNCINWRDLGDGRGPGCPVWDAHYLFVSDSCTHESCAEETGQEEHVIQIGDGSDRVVVDGNHTMSYSQKWKINLRALTGVLDTLIPRTDYTDPKSGHVYKKIHNGQCAMFYGKHWDKFDPNQPGLFSEGEDGAG